MDVTVNRDHIGVIIAVAVFLFALTEAVKKHFSSQTEADALLYSKFMYIWSQVISSENDIRKLLQMSKEKYLREELLGFAKAHLLSSDVIKATIEFEELAHTTLSTPEEIQSALIFASHSRSIFTTVNTFYQGVLVNEQEHEENTQICDRILKMSKTHLLIKFSILQLKIPSIIAPPLEADLMRLSENSDISTIDTEAKNSKLAKILQNHRNKRKQRDAFVVGMYQVVVIALILCCLCHIFYLHFQLTHLPWG